MFVFKEVKISNDMDRFYVGHYTPDGEFHTVAKFYVDGDFKETKREAIEFVHYLNGGSSKAIEELNREVTIQLNKMKDTLRYKGPLVTQKRYYPPPLKGGGRGSNGG